MKKRSLAKAARKLTSDKNPTEETDAYWIHAYRLTDEYPKPSNNCGKWLIFEDVGKIDDVWREIKLATEAGLLGSAAKVATARPSPNATNNNVKVICVYSYDYTDENDVMRIREELRKIGIERKIPYKTDKATLAGKYRVMGDSRISVYYD